MPRWLIDRRKPYSSLMSPVILVGNLPQISTITKRAAAVVTSRSVGQPHRAHAGLGVDAFVDVDQRRVLGEERQSGIEVADRKGDVREQAKAAASWDPSLQPTCTTV